MIISGVIIRPYIEMTDYDNRSFKIYAFCHSFSISLMTPSEIL